MSFTLAGQTLTVEVNVIDASNNPILSNPPVGEYKITELRLASDGKTLIVKHSDTPES